MNDITYQPLYDYPIDDSEWECPCQRGVGCDCDGMEQKARDDEEASWEE